MKSEVPILRKTTVCMKIGLDAADFIHEASGLTLMFQK
jgi:hypothetical protein